MKLCHKLMRSKRGKHLGNLTFWWKAHIFMESFECKYFRLKTSCNIFILFGKHGLNWSKIVKSWLCVNRMFWFLLTGFRLMLKCQMSFQLLHVVSRGQWRLLRSGKETEDINLRLPSTIITTTQFKHRMGTSNFLVGGFGCHAMGGLPWSHWSHCVGPTCSLGADD